MDYSHSYGPRLARLDALETLIFLLVMKSIHSTKSATFGGLILESFWISFGGIVASLGLLATIFTFILLPKDLTVGLRYVIPLAIIGLCAVILMAHAAWSCLSPGFTSTSSVPKYREAVRPGIP